MFPARVLRTRPTKALVSVPQSVETMSAESRKRKKKEKRTSGNYACKKCSRFYADSAKKLEAHERRCIYLQELAAYVTQRDLLLIEMNERDEYCCKACKFNFKFRKDNLLAHVQNNLCRNGAKMPPKPVDRDNPKQFIERQTMRKTTKIEPLKAIPSALNPKTAKPKIKAANENPMEPTKISTTSMKAVAEISDSSNRPIVATKINITVPDESPITSSYTENYVIGTDVNHAIDTGAFLNCTYNDFNSLTRNADRTYVQAVDSPPVSLTTAAAHEIPQTSIMAYAPTYYPSYSQYAEFSPMSVPFEEIIGTLNSAQQFSSLSNRK
jgi:ribosomal protein L37AE/L43A